MNPLGGQQLRKRLQIRKKIQPRITTGSQAIAQPHHRRLQRIAKSSASRDNGHATGLQRFEYGARRLRE